jgi:hypothetical protein
MLVAQVGHGEIMELVVAAEAAAPILLAQQAQTMLSAVAMVAEAGVLVLLLAQVGLAESLAGVVAAVLVPVQVVPLLVATAAQADAAKSGYGRIR